MSFNERGIDPEPPSAPPMAIRDIDAEQINRTVAKVYQVVMQLATNGITITPPPIFWFQLKPFLIQIAPDKTEEST